MCAPPTAQALDFVIRDFGRDPSARRERRHADYRSVQVAEVSTPASLARDREFQESIAGFLAESYSLPRPPSVLLEDVTAQLAELIRRINRTNSVATLQNGVTLTDALATRDVLLKRRGVYAELANAAAIGQERYSRSEVKFKSTVNVSEIQGQVDTLSREYRELDSRLQEANWAIELVD